MTVGLMDLGFLGLPFTWDNRQEVNNNIKVRLDRGLANSELLDLFYEAKVSHEPRGAITVVF